jgi:hypothetical protein
MFIVIGRWLKAVPMMVTPELMPSVAAMIATVNYRGSYVMILERLQKMLK